MTKPWKPYACTVPAAGVTGTCSVLSTVHHVTHTEPALRILADGKVTRGLIYDESILNDSRTTVVWLSPNNWYDGSRYGCVQFTFDFADIVARRKVYWVEVREYKRHAYRFIISDQDLSKLPVTQYDPTKEEGPLRQVGGVWYWNSKHTAEFLLDSSLLLHYCKKIDFILHHDKFCAAPGGCGELGHDGTNAAGRALAFLLARGLRGFNDTLIVTDPKTALSTAAERGILKAYEDLSANLSGPAKSNDSVDAALRAALLQLAVGETTLAHPPEQRHVASIRLDQSPLRWEQISVKLSSPLPSPGRRGRGQADLSVISDIEIVSWIPWVLGRGARPATPQYEIMHCRSLGSRLRRRGSRTHVFVHLVAQSLVRRR